MSVGRIFIVDDDEGQRSALKTFLTSIGLPVQALQSPQAFLAVYETNGPAVLVTDMVMGNMSGLALLSVIREKFPELAVIVISAYADIRSAVDAMKLGAFEFLEKPIRNQELLDCIHEALQSSKGSYEEVRRKQETKRRLSVLTIREQEVFELLTQGYTNKSVAASLGISSKTVEVHRANIMKKLEAKSLVEFMALKESVSTSH